MRPIIKKHKDFELSEDDPTYRTEFFVARARKTKWPGDAKYGIKVTKKTLKRSVDRNHGKRMLRVWIRANEKHMSPDMDYIFIIRAGVLDADFELAQSLMRTALKKLKVLSVEC
ncbi:MAG: ribonuclease P protein component [Alphaproteobacteria bacterium]|nr:ribonuclease P protein component [Alphaproteobacteria bacterium]MCL2757837.1 ribonuclease P protein component [Alphaproteobacteria bacterium]